MGNRFFFSFYLLTRSKFLVEKRKKLDRCEW